jgi:hypothetical protein
MKKKITLYFEDLHDADKRKALRVDAKEGDEITVVIKSRYPVGTGEIPPLISA